MSQAEKANVVMALVFSQATPVKVTYRNVVRFTSVASQWETVAALVAQEGEGDMPTIENLAVNPPPAPKSAVVALVPVAAPSPPPLTPRTPFPSDTGVSREGETRSLADFAGAVAGGFAPAQTLYTRGTPVNSLGVANAKRSRLEHDALPVAHDACNDFRSRIASEGRRDEITTLSSLRMTKGGKLALPSGARLAIGKNAFSDLANFAGFGGGKYLADNCTSELRALNVNHQMLALASHEAATRKALTTSLEQAEYTPKEVKLGTRVNGSDREVFRAVSPGYAAFGVEKVAEALQEAMPSEAKARIVYNGERAVFDIQFHSNVQAKHYVAGEFFKAGIRIRTDDTGGGSIIGSAIVFQNLCLNLIIIDEATQPLFRLRHVGSVHALAREVRKGIQEGLKKLSYFLRAWDVAVEEDVLRTVQVAPGDEKPLSIEEALPGFFNGIIERELVPVRGRRPEVIKSLRTMWAKDTSAAAGPTRASVVNAFTRYAHEVETDAFAADEIERSVSSLLYGKRGAAPALLPYVPVKK